MAEERKKQKTPRAAAVDILDRIESDDAHAEPLIDRILSGAEIPNPQDRGLLTELVYGTLRMRGRLDWIIARHYRGEFAALEIPVKNILRTAAYQLFFTDRIPAFAAVNEAVGIARKVCPAAAGLVNAVLRGVLRGKDQIRWPEMAKDMGRAIAVFHSHPRWLVERWLDRYGIDETVGLCGANNAIAPLSVRVNRLKTSREKAIAALATEGIIAEAARWSPDGLTLSTPAAGLRECGAFRNGLIRVQDEASQLVAFLCAPQPGERILDLCAGSGGKSLHLAARMNNRGEITAVDRNRDRLRLLSAESGRLGITIVETVPGDAATPPEPFLGAFDRVLLDAPCSGLGTLRRNPEIRWRITPADIEGCARRQRRLLRSAARCVKPGGALIYTTCTVTPEENEEIAADFVDGHPAWTRLQPAGLPAEVIDADGFFRTSPDRHGTDGFFGALFIRNA